MKYLILIALTLSSLTKVMAHPYSARREFFQLKSSAEFVDYLQNGTYVEVVGTSLIGLQSASNGVRTGLFGFQSRGLNGPGTFQIETRFVCFPSQKYELSLKKEWCELGMKGCEIDPGGISVGIGNLDILPDYDLGEPLPLPRPRPYPRYLNVDVFPSSLPLFEEKVEGPRIISGPVPF